MSKRTKTIVLIHLKNVVASNLHITHYILVMPYQAYQHTRKCYLSHCFGLVAQCRSLETRAATLYRLSKQHHTDVPVTCTWSSKPTVHHARHRQTEKTRTSGLPWLENRGTDQMENNDTLLIGMHSGEKPTAVTVKPPARQMRWHQIYLYNKLLKNNMQTRPYSAI